MAWGWGGWGGVGLGGVGWGDEDHSLFDRTCVWPTPSLECKNTRGLFVKHCIESRSPGGYVCPTNGGSCGRDYDRLLLPCRRFSINLLEYVQRMADDRATFFGVDRLNSFSGNVFIVVVAYPFTARYIEVGSESTFTPGQCQGHNRAETTCVIILVKC